MPDLAKTQVILVGYERGVLDVSSPETQRIRALSDASTSVEAVVISRSDADVTVTDGDWHASGWRGGWFRRVWHAVKTGYRHAKASPHATVVSGQDPFVAGAVAYLISRFTNVPLEIQEHGDFFSGAWVKESWKHRLLSCLGTCILHRAEHVRAVSERVKEHLIRMGVAAERIDVIPVSQDLAPLLAKTTASDATDGFRIIAPCRFVAQKGLDVLIAAAAMLKARKVDFRLSIIGAGPLEGAMRSQISKANVEDQVVIGPWRDATALWEGADLFVLSSTYEGWGRTIVEAMAAGVPVVTTDVGCVGSFFRPQIDGRVVQPHDAAGFAAAIQEQINEPDRRDAMRDAARERAASFPRAESLRDQQRNGWRHTLLQQASGARSSKIPGPRIDLWVAAYVAFIIATRAASVILFHNSLLVHDDGPFLLVQSFLQGHGYTFASDLGCPSAYKSPAFLFFLTALYTFFSPDNTWAQAIAQNLFVVGVLWLVYAVGKRLVGKRAALVGGVLMACYPYTFYHYTQYYHTFLSSFFLLLLVWMLLRLKESRSYRFAVGSGFAIACLAYVQGTILPATPFISLWLLIVMRREWKKAFAFIAIMGVVSVGMIAPWTYRNWRAFHQFVPLTTDLGLALFKANSENIYEITRLGYPQEIVDEIEVSSTNPEYIHYRIPDSLTKELTDKGAKLRPSIFWTEWIPREPAEDHLVPCRDLGTLNEVQYAQYWQKLAVDRIRTTYWTEIWKLQLQKVRTFWQPALFPSVKMGAPWSFANSPLKVWLARNSVTAASSIVIFGGLIGLFAFLRKRDQNVWLTVIILLVYTFMHSFFAGYTKYRIPLDNLTAIYAGWTIVAIWDRVRRKRNV